MSSPVAEQDCGCALVFHLPAYCTPIICSVSEALETFRVATQNAKIQRNRKKMYRP